MKKQHLIVIAIVLASASVCAHSLIKLSEYVEVRDRIRAEAARIEAKAEVLRTVNTYKIVCIPPFIVWVNTKDGTHALALHPDDTPRTCVPLNKPPVPAPKRSDSRDL